MRFLRNTFLTLAALLLCGSLQAQSRINEPAIIRDNSTTTALANGASFTGAWHIAENQSAVTVWALTDQTGILEIDFSTNCTS